jgi:hypothetical protein
MRADRPLIASVVFLATGLSLIFGYCHGTAALSAAFPVTGSTLQLAITTTGLAAMGGIAFTGVGLVLLLWALFAAIVSQVSLLAEKPEHHDRIILSESPRITPAERTGSL